MEEFIKSRSYLGDIFKNIPVYVAKSKDIGIEGAYAKTHQDMVNWA